VPSQAGASDNGRTATVPTARPSPPWLARRATRAAAVASVASAAPETVVSSAEVAERIGVTERWVISRTGVRERRIAASGDRLSSLAARAGGDALERAGVSADALDLVLVATMTSDEITPNAAPFVAHEVGCRSAGALDLGAACNGFVAGLALAASQVEVGRADHVLVVGADLLSRVTDHEDAGTAALFGDGAGAVVVGPAGEESGAIGPFVLDSDATQAGLINASYDDRVIRMQGQDVYREAVARLTQVTEQAAARAGVGLEDIDLFVYHQANKRILVAVGERLGLQPARVVDCIDRYGNTSAATVPIALAEAESDGRLEPGALVLVGAFGAGFTWGAGVVQW
jgi:3-oxoacyl-[acyl-carrier-protein] synthase-3